jgi:CheY-like chemotaxis protein
VTIRIFRILGTPPGPWCPTLLTSPDGTVHVTVKDAAEPITVLIVDDEPDMRLLTRTELQHAGMHVISEAANGADAIAIFAELDPPPVPTVVLLDNRMPGQSGLEVAAHLLAGVPDQLIVLFTAFIDDEVEREAARLGVRACVSKLNVVSLPGVIKTLVATGP